MAKAAVPTIQPLLLRRKEVAQLLAVSMTQLTRLEARPDFPRPVNYGFGIRKAYVRVEIEAYAQNRMAARDEVLNPGPPKRPRGRPTKAEVQARRAGLPWPPREPAPQAAAQPPATHPAPAQLITAPAAAEPSASA